MSLSVFKLITRPVLLTVLLFQSNTLFALSTEQAKPILNNIHDIMSNSFQAINAYYNFSMSPGDKVMHAQVLEEIGELDALFSSLESRDGVVEIQGELAAMSEIWIKYKDLLNTNINDVINLGYPDLRLAADMAQLNSELVSAGNKAFTKTTDTSGHKEKPEIELIRNSKLLLERMLTNYSARSASNVSQIFQGAEGEKAIDELAVDFDKLLEKLMKSSLNTGPNKKRLDVISTQWNFIRKSFVNYAENNVSYVVNRYSLKISDTLSEMLEEAGS